MPKRGCHLKRTKPQRIDTAYRLKPRAKFHDRVVSCPVLAGQKTSAKLCEVEQRSAVPEKRIRLRQVMAAFGGLSLDIHLSENRVKTATSNRLRRASDPRAVFAIKPPFCRPASGQGEFAEPPDAPRRAGSGRHPAASERLMKRRCDRARPGTVGSGHPSAGLHRHRWLASLTDSGGGEGRTSPARPHHAYFTELTPANSGTVCFREDTSSSKEAHNVTVVYQDGVVSTRFVWKSARACSQFWESHHHIQFKHQTNVNTARRVN